MTTSVSMARADAGGVQWGRSLLWLAFLAPFFFLSYGFANGMAARWGVTDSIVYGWERQIPFWDWTIVPYWSIDLIYGLSFLLCQSRAEVDCHGRRLLTAQLISVACFLLFPLRFTFERPVTDGLFGWMFDALMGFDKPYNQAPSLHISLLVILWNRYWASGGIWLGHLWFALIGLSVLTTYQHHFIDLPTGALAGLFCLWLWPQGRPSPLKAWERGVGPVRRRLAWRYLAGAVALAGPAIIYGGTALWLWWISIALGLAAFCYAAVGSEGFQKQDGRHSLAVSVLAAPYFAGAWLNSRAWTYRHPQPDPIADGVWLGRMPGAKDMAEGGFAGLFDCTAELPAPRGAWRYDNLPWLDLVPPTPRQLAEAARRIEALRGPRPVLVCCALGYSRSAAAVAAWLLHSGRVGNVEAAVKLLQAKRPGLVLGEKHREALAECQRERGDD